MLNGDFVGFQRTVIEYLEAGGDKWQLDEIPHNPSESIALAEPPYGTAGFKRERIRSKVQTEGSENER